MSDQEKNKRMTQTLFILSGNISTTPRARKVAEYIAKTQIVEILGINRTKVWASLDTDFEHKTGIKTNTIDIKQFINMRLCKRKNKHLFVFQFIF